MVHEIAMGLLPVFFVIGLGFFSGKTKLIDNRHVSTLNTVVMTIALPLLLFTTLASSARSDIVNHLPAGVAVCAVMLVVYGAVFLLERRIFRLPTSKAVIMALTVAFPNAAAVALPLADSVLGGTGRLAVAVTLAVGAITVSPLTLVVLELDKNRTATSAGSPPSKGNGWGKALLAAYRKPLVIAPILGLAWTLLGIPLPDLVDATFTQLGDVTGGLGLFVTGLVLSAQPLKLTWNVAISTLIGAIVRPALAVVAILALGLRGDPAGEVFLILSVPAGFFGILLGLTYGVVAKRAGATLMYSTVLSIVTLPIAIALVRSFG